MPKTPEQFLETRKLTRAKIKTAALKLFGEKGYQATSISAISKEAGISKGLMYNYFESKEDLIKSIFKKEFKESADRWNAVLEKEITPFEKLTEYTELTLKLVEENVPYWKLMRSMVLNPALNNTIFKEVLNDPKIKELYVSSKNKVKDLFKEIGCENTDKEMMFHGVFLEGLIGTIVASSENLDLTEMKNVLINRYKNKEALEKFKLY